MSWFTELIEASSELLMILQSIRWFFPIIQVFNLHSENQKKDPNVHRTRLERLELLTKLVFFSDWTTFKM